MPDLVISQRSRARVGLTYCWTVPIGARRWHVSSDGMTYECGAWPEHRHKGNSDLQNIRWPDFPVLACIKCVSTLAKRHKERLG